MKALKLIAIVMLAGFALQSCSSTKNVTKAQLTDKWVLKTINNVPASQVFTNGLPYLLFNFDINQVSGKGGCNTFSGKFTYNGGEFRAPNLASTMMACPGIDQESTFYSLLGETSKLSIMNGDLIFSQNDKPVLVFSRAMPLTAADLSGVWIMESMEGKSANSDFSVKAPTLELNFMDNRVSGSAGCNTYNAPFTLMKNVLDVKPMITTRMACEDMKGETKFVNLLPGRSDVDIENNMLVIRRDNKTIMTFRR